MNGYVMMSQIPYFIIYETNRIYSQALSFF